MANATQLAGWPGYDGWGCYGGARYQIKTRKTREADDVMMGRVDLETNPHPFDYYVPILLWPDWSIRRAAVIEFDVLINMKQWRRSSGKNYKDREMYNFHFRELVLTLDNVQDITDKLREYRD